MKDVKEFSDVERYKINAFDVAFSSNDWSCKSALAYGSHVSQSSRFKIGADIIKKCKDETNCLPIRVLDFGCGIGDFGKMISNIEPVTWYGLEPQKVFADKCQIEINKGVIRDGFVLCGDITSISYFQTQFDVVVANSVFGVVDPHWDKSEYAKYVTETLVRLFVKYTTYALVVDFLTPRKQNYHSAEWGLNEEEAIHLALGPLGAERFDLIRSYAPHVYTLVVYVGESFWKRNWRANHEYQ